MALGKWLAWAGYEIAKTDERRRAEAEYAERWKASQVALMAELRSGKQTLKGAEAYLRGLPKAAWTDAWWKAQWDLVTALQDGKMSMKAAAINLGMIAPGEE